jgi:predicted SAM-dependent methyltransferase
VSAFTRRETVLKSLWRKYSTSGLRHAIYNARREYQLCKMHRGSVRKSAIYARRTDLRLNLGCGSNLKPGWVNIDLGGDAKLHLDLREPFPFADSSADIVYSEHLFEHLSYPEDAQHFLRESLRVLKPGGKTSIGVPDMEWPLVSYGTNDAEYFNFVRNEWHPSWCNTRAHNINYHFRQGSEHKYAYDAETLESVLREAGFTDIRRREFDPEMDSEHRKRGTIYMDARKPSE